MVERLAVIGAGAAGLAAVWAATKRRRRGLELRVFDGGIGATYLGGGAVDDRPWEEIARAAEVLGRKAVAGQLPPVVSDVAAELDLWKLPRAGEPLVRLATEAGRVRLARGHDRALLDLARLPDGARVLMPRVVRPEWDADALARCLTHDAFAQARRMRFEAVDAELLKFVEEQRIAPGELAARHDRAERREFLIDRLRDMLGRVGRAHAVLLGPWLGAASSQAEEIARRLGIVTGEVLGGVGGAAGLRFEAARDRLLSAWNVELTRDNVTRVARQGRELRVWCAEDSWTCDAAILAVGGLVAGGIVYDPPEQVAGQDMPPAGAVPFRLSLEAPVRLCVAGRPLDLVSSMHGPTLDEIAWPTDADPSHLEAVGIACEGVEAAPDIFVAGDAMADSPRTVLQALYSGALAGTAAAAS